MMKEKRLYHLLGCQWFCGFFWCASHTKKNHKTTATKQLPLALTKKTRNHEKWKKK